MMCARTYRSAAAFNFFGIMPQSHDRVPPLPYLLPYPCPMQVSGWQGLKALHAENGGSVVVYRGMLDCFVKTVREEGWSALFKVGDHVCSSNSMQRLMAEASKTLELSSSILRCVWSDQFWWFCLSGHASCLITAS
jgi:hypothetical protein